MLLQLYCGDLGEVPRGARGWGSMTTSADALASLAALVLSLREAAANDADEKLQLEAIAAVHNSLATSPALEAALPHVLAALEPLSRTISDEPKGSALTPAVATAAARALADTRTHVPAARLFWLLDECGVVDGAPSPHALPEAAAAAARASASFARDQLLPPKGAKRNPATPLRAVQLALEALAVDYAAADAAAGTAADADAALAVLRRLPWALRPATALQTELDSWADGVGKEPAAGALAWRRRAAGILACAPALFGAVRTARRAADLLAAPAGAAAAVADDDDPPIGPLAPDWLKREPSTTPSVAARQSPPRRGRATAPQPTAWWRVRA